MISLRLTYDVLKTKEKLRVPTLEMYSIIQKPVYIKTRPINYYTLSVYLFFWQYEKK